MTIKSIIKIISLPAILFSIILYVLFMFSDSNSKLKQKITELETLNKVMKAENVKWANYNDSLILIIEKSNAELAYMKKRDEELYNKLQFLNTQITKLKDKYEKANNFTANYNADSVKQYFSNLK
jgi:lipopolysaccharide export LptBFGC system permease protein LptF